jgi:hypothetical protein
LKGTSADLGEFSVFLKEGEKKRVLRLIVLEGNESPKVSKSLSKVKGLPDLARTHFNGYSLPPSDVWKVKDAVQSTLKRNHQKVTIC